MNNNVELKFRKRLQCELIQEWEKCLQESNKCITYRTIKDTFEFENYLYVIPKPWCVYIAKFRLSSHKLPIETGRYTNILREERLCKKCNSNSIGDEFHTYLNVKM